MAVCARAYNPAPARQTRTIDAPRADNTTATEIETNDDDTEDPSGRATNVDPSIARSAATGSAESVRRDMPGRSRRHLPQTFPGRLWRWKAGGSRRSYRDRSSSNPARHDKQQQGEPDIMSTATDSPVRNGVDTATLFATLDAVKGDNDIAKFQFRATNKWISGTHNQSTILRLARSPDPRRTR